MIADSYIQSKLKSLHEVVVRNRLEQLRKKQRDEALQAQEELLAGVAQSASTRPIPTSADQIINNQVAEDEDEEREPYDRSMSPILIDITRLAAEERQIDIITVKEDLRALVIVFRTLMTMRFLTSMHR